LQGHIRDLGDTCDFEGIPNGWVGSSPRSLLRTPLIPPSPSILHAPNAHDRTAADDKIRARTNGCYDDGVDNPFVLQWQVMKCFLFAGVHIQITSDINRIKEKVLPKAN